MMKEVRLWGEGQKREVIYWKAPRHIYRKPGRQEHCDQAQAVVFPLEYGMTMEQTAEAIGVSPGWACQLRNRFIKEGSISEAGKPLRGGRRRENMSIEEERAFLLPFFERAKTGGFLVVNDIKEAMDKRVGRHVALASAYNLLHRHGWRKLAPDKRHPQYRKTPSGRSPVPNNHRPESF